MKESFEKIGSEGKPEIPKEEIFVDEIFDPEEELAKIKEEIKKGPKEEQSGLRKKLISEFKEKLIWQRKGIADLKDRLENFIEKSPDEPKEKFLEIVEKGRKEHSLSENQTRKFNQVIDRYLEKHQIIQKYVKEYQEQFGSDWPREFFKDCFQKYPKGKVEIEVEPAHFVWICHLYDDFETFCNEEACLITPLWYGFKRSAGFFPSGLEDCLIGFNLEIIKRDNQSIKNIREHEKQHILWHLQTGELKPPLNILSEKSELKDIYFLNQYLKEYTKNCLDWAANEILAYSKEGENFEKIREYHLSQIFRKNSVKFKLESKIPLKLSKKFNQILDQEETIFKHQVNKGLQSAHEISQISPYQDRKKLVDLLSLEPLSKWSRLLRLLRETEI